MRNKIVLSAIAAIWCCAAVALDVVDDARISISASGVDLCPATTQIDSFPSDISGVIFRFDASNREGWEYDSEDASKIVKIPSLVGDGRYLTIRTDEGGQWHGYADLESPRLVTDVAALQGGSAVDFGASGSGRGMVFNPTDRGNQDNALTNALYDVGTVISVYDSSDGGGWILGGGFVWNEGYSYHRGGNGTGNVYSDPIFNPNHALPAARQGVVYQNGQATTPTLAGFVGDWQTLALQPTEATLDVTGLGIGDARSEGYSWKRMGGMKIAEIVFYNRVLTSDELMRMEAYLAKKWFGRKRAGYGDLARVQQISVAKAGVPGAFAAGADVPEGTTLSVGVLEGGRGAADPVFTKKGVGAMQIEDASDFAGRIEVRQGALRFPSRRAVPLAPPSRYGYRVDPSAANGFTSSVESGKEYLVEAKELAGALYGDLGIAFSATGNARPLVVRDALGTGKHVLDFGTYGSGRFLKMKRAGMDAEVPADSNLRVMTVLAVVDARQGGGQLLGSSESDPAASCLVRAETNGVNFLTGLIGPESITGRGGKTEVWIDGFRQEPTAGYPTPDWHVVAIRVPTQEGHFNRIGVVADKNAFSGGLRLGELIAYRRALDEEEIRDCMAYLAAKWFGRTLPGYAGADADRKLRVQELSTADGTTIDVPSGTVVVGPINITGKLVKRGAGTLEIRARDEYYDGLSVEEGEVRFVSAPDLVNEGFAPSPVLHLDADDAAFFDNATSVSCWHDKTGNNAAFNFAAKQRCWTPGRKTETATLVNGHPFVSFNDYPGQYYSASLSFARSINSVRSAFVLWGRQNAGNGGYLLGSSSKNGDANGDYYDFMRKVVSNVGKELFAPNETLKHVSGGTILIDGVETGNVDPGEAKYELVEVYPSAPAHVSGIGCDRDYLNYSGGPRICEIILYDRVLTDREKAGTRDYLMRKWLASAPIAVPAFKGGKAKFHSFSDELATKFSSDGSVDIVVDREFTVADGFTKTGNSELAIVGLGGVTGLVSVAQGSLKMLKSFEEGDEFVPEDDAILFHGDATKNVEVEVRNGVQNVVKWTSANGNGVTARPAGTGYPTLMPNGLEDRPAIDMGKHCQAAFDFYDKDGVKTELTGVMSVFWVIGSQNGGGFLLGGSENDWHRGTVGWDGGVPSALTSTILGGSSKETVKTGSWRMNGSPIAPLESYLSGGWDILDMNVAGDPSKANGIAMDGRTETWCLDRMGGQRLAELIICNRKMSDGERLEIERYLKHKWRFAQVGIASADVDLASGTVFDLAGNDSVVRTLSGTGTIRGDGTLTVKSGWTVALDGSSDANACLELESGAKLAFAPDAVMTVSFTSEPVLINGQRRYLVLSAGEGVEATSVRGLKIVAQGLSEGIRTKLRVDEDGVWLCLSNRGIVMIVR